MLPEVRNSVTLITESNQGSLWICLFCATSKASGGHHIQPHDRSVYYVESIRWSIYQM